MSRTTLINLAGQVFGHWTVIERAIGKYCRVHWLCVCVCGKQKAVSSLHLTRGTSTNCGCSRPRGADSGRFNGYPKSHPLYSTWCNIVQRCENSNNPQFRDYGGRGIGICPEWRADFWQFVRDMGQRPTPSHTIDRRDNNLGYSPENCRWATMTEQSRNRRGRNLVTINGETMPLSAAVEVYGGKYHSVKWRLKRGQTIEEALKL